MKPKTLVVLAVAVALLGAFIWFVERDLPGSDERAELAKKVLGDLDSEDVEAVDIAWDQGRIRLERDLPDDPSAAEDPDVGSPEPESWRLVEPRAARADTSEVSSLLSRLTSLEKKRTVDDVDRAAVGLESPEVTVTLAISDGQERVLEVGSEVPVSEDRFVALAGRSEVFVVAGSIYDELVRDPTEWRDRDVFTADRDDVTRVEIRTGERDAGVVLVRDGDGYRLEAPVRDRADGELVRTFVGRLVDLRAQSFVEEPVDGGDDEGDDGTDLGLDPPAAVLTATLGPEDGEAGDQEGSEEGSEAAGKTAQLEVGAVLDEELGRRYGRSGDQVFVFQNRELMEDALRPADAWRSASWSGSQVFRIDSVQVQAPSGELTVSRSGSDWQRGDDRVPYTTVSDLLYALTDAEAERFVSEEEARSAGWALDSPTHTLTVRSEGSGGSEGSEEVEVLTLYPPVEDGVPARASDREPVLLLPAERLTVLDEAIAAIRNAEPISGDDLEEGGGDEGLVDDGFADDGLEDDLEIFTEEG